MDDGTCESVFSLRSPERQKLPHRVFIDPGMKDRVHRTSAEGQDQAAIPSVGECFRGAVL